MKTKTDLWDFCTGVLVVVLVYALTKPPPPESMQSTSSVIHDSGKWHASAMRARILDHEFLRGDITVEEYRDSLDALEW